MISSNETRAETEALDVSSPKPSGRAWLWLALWTCVGLGLIWALLRAMSVTPSDVWQALRATPFWVFLAVGVLTFSNKVIGTLKWLASARYLASPVEGHPFWRLVEMTNLGAVFGQLIPVQLSTLLVRWFLLGRQARASGQVVGATFFEQSFDLVLVLAGTTAALAAFVLGVSVTGGLGVFVFCVGFAVVAMRPLFRLGAVVFRWATRLPFGSGVFQRAAEGFAKAGAAPPAVVWTLAGYSLARLVVVGLRVVVIFAAFAPEAASWLIFVVTPGVTLITALPITPAGLGVAEWSWSAILVAAGTPAAAAAIAALNLRLVTFAMMLVIAGLLGVLTRTVLKGRGA